MFVDSRCRRDEQETDRYTWNHHRCNEDHYFSCSSRSRARWELLNPFLSCCHLEPNEKESKSVKLQIQRKRIEQTKEQRPYFVGSTYLAKGSGTSSFGPFHRHSDFALDFESYIIGFLLLFLCLLLRLLLKQWSISVTTALIRLDKGESVDRAYGPQDLLLSGRLLLSHTRTDFDFHV